MDARGGKVRGERGGEGPSQAGIMGMSSLKVWVGLPSVVLRVQYGIQGVHTKDSCVARPNIPQIGVKCA